MFIREIWGKFTSFFEILKFPSFYAGDFSKFQENELGNLIPNFPLKHMITSTN